MTTAPKPSSDYGTGCPQCYGGYIDTATNLSTGNVFVTFSNISYKDLTTGNSWSIGGTYGDSATFTAKYGGAELGCAVGDGKSPLTGDTDCLIWKSNLVQIALSGSGSGNLAGDYLQIILNNATDWNITNTIQFDLSSHNQLITPIPAALPLFASGLGGLGLLGWRRKRKAAAARAAA
jgi:hypothetical protein